MRPAKLNRGFTLIEVLIATMLLAVGLVGSIALTLSMMRANRTNSGRDVAYFLGQQALDQLGLFPMTTVGLGAGALLPPTSTPGVNDNPIGMVAAGGTPPATTCSVYPMSDAALGDTPGTCNPGTNPNLSMPSYFVRTWVCCAPSTGNLAGEPCAANALATVGVGGLKTPDTLNQGVLCLLQAEVTWPTENLNPNGTATFGAPSLINGPVPALLFSPEGRVPPQPPPTLPYGNHVLLGEVRML
ncbi:MAG TPA: prepilin-type N-terminal cleavage/methylation domain-containing protein [Myxococcales bacterium]|nr:prepilin-type N-terminal cleavage/methylation domain-containing protein [Myxococcales bacterium]